jgi:hypothetical protein
MEGATLCMRLQWRTRGHGSGSRVICGRGGCARLRPGGRGGGRAGGGWGIAGGGIARWQNRAAVDAYTKDIRTSRDYRIYIVIRYIYTK